MGGSAIIVSDWNENVVVVNNEFSWLGESGVVVVGSADGLDGISNMNQPNGTIIAGSLFREVGMFVAYRCCLERKATNS